MKIHMEGPTRNGFKMIGRQLAEALQKSKNSIDQGPFTLYK